MTRTVVGVDASSTRLAAVILDAPLMHTASLKLPSDIAGACVRATEWMADLITEYRPTLIAVEAPFIHHAHPSGAIGMAQVNGALLAGTKDQQVISVTPSHWKKSVLGKGNASKQEISEWVSDSHTDVHALLSVMPYAQDLLDAYCVALHGMHVISIRDKIVLAQ